MNAILIDDEYLSLEYLEKMLTKVSNFNIVGKFTDPFILDKLKEMEDEIDVIFLDIKMPGSNGINLAEQLIALNPNLLIVFVTAYDEFAVQAFELKAVDYLLKPIDSKRLAKTVERINEAYSIKISVKATSDKLQIGMFKELTLRIGEKKINRLSWRTTKSLELFLYLLHHANKIVKKDEIIDIIWRNLDISKAYSQMYVTIHYIRKTIKSIKQYIEISSLQDGYILTLNNAEINVKEWEEKVKFGLNDSLNPCNVLQLEDALELYQGPYLETYHFLWAENEKQRLEKLWLRSAYKIANWYWKQNDLENAAIWYINICDIKPEDENAHFALMKIYNNNNLGILVEHQYHQLKSTLKDLDIPISPSIDAWYNNWKYHK